MVCLAAAARFTQRTRGGARVTARAVPPHGAERPPDRAARDAASPHPVPSSSGGAAQEDRFRPGPGTFAPRFEHPARPFHHRHPFGLGCGYIEAGPHPVEIRADGFETVTFDVRIVPNETLTFRTDLKRQDVSPPPAAAPPRPTRRTQSVIPRCYAGDTPPRAEQLPAGCDSTRVRTIP